MSERTYDKIQHLLPIVQTKLATGMTQEKVAKEMELTRKLTSILTTIAEYGGC